MMIKRDDQNAFGPRTYFLVTDNLDADSEHTYKLAYHFGPGIEVASDEAGFTAIDRRRNLLHIGQFATVPFRVGTSDGMVSRSYSLKQKATIGWAEATGGGRQTFSSVIFPVCAGSLKRPVISRFAGSHDGISVLSSGGIHDLFLFGETEMRDGDLWVRTCARITWLRLAKGRLQSAAIIDGSALAIDGVFRISSSSSGYLLAEVGDGHLAVYSDDISSLDVCNESGLPDVRVNDRAPRGAEAPLPAEMKAG